MKNTLALYLLLFSPFTHPMQLFFPAKSSSWNMFAPKKENHSYTTGICIGAGLVLATGGYVWYRWSRTKRTQQSQPRERAQASSVAVGFLGAAHSMEDLSQMNLCEPNQNQRNRRLDFQQGRSSIIQRSKRPEFFPASAAAVSQPAAHQVRKCDFCKKTMYNLSCGCGLICLNCLEGFTKKSPTFCCLTCKKSQKNPLIDHEQS